MLRILMVAILISCTSCATEPSPAELSTSEDPPDYLGAADGFGDAADRSCRVVLDSVVPFDDTVDPSDKAVLVRALRGDDLEAPTVQLLYDIDCDTCSGSWQALDPIDVVCDDSDYCTYLFRVLAHHPLTTYLIPYIVTDTGRLFDHNRPEVADDFDTYVLDSTNYRMLPEAEVPCTEDASTPADPPEETTGDAADRSCRVVLDSVVPFDDTVDPSDKAVLVRALRGDDLEAPTVQLLYDIDCDTCSGSWQALDPIDVVCDDSDYCTYLFRVLAHHPLTTYLIPYIVTDTGRLFDHNRPEVADDFDTYVLDSTNYRLLPAADVCQ